MENICIKVEDRDDYYMDFLVSCDENLYRYYAATGKIKKLFGFSGHGFSGHGQAVRGKKRKAVEALAKIAFEGNLPFAIAM